MQYLVFTSLICLAFTFASAARIPKNASERREEVIAGLTEIWSIPRKEVEVCLSKTKATYDDFMSFQEVFQTEGENDDGVRRASCALVCCAQAQGTMSGTNVDMAAVHNLITDSKSTSNRVKPLLHTVVDECAALVKNINDGCDKFLEFMKCVIDDKWQELNGY